MSVWEQYDNDQRKEYIKFLQVYGALTNLFKQKQGDIVPYLDSKFQETVFSRVFKSKIVDKGNTPHDVVSVFENIRIGIGLKTWSNSRPSFQKVMQLKSFQNEINIFKNDAESLAFKISEIKNDRLKFDYARLSLSEDKNIYHYITRDNGKFTINECPYKIIDIDNLKDLNLNTKSFTWQDGNHDYKYTFGDSQIWQKFDPNKYNTEVINQFDIKVLEDPFDFLMKAYFEIIESSRESTSDFVEVYLPLYSYRNQDVEEKSGLNAWNAAPKNKKSDQLRPLNEIYIPIPIEFHRKYPDFFCENILEIIKERKTSEKSKPEVRFKLNLPNDKTIPALLTGDNMKNFQSGSKTEKDESTGKNFGQNALGQWLLVDVLGLKERKKVTREWLEKKGTDSLRLWRRKGDYSEINIDFASIGSFEAFMNGEPVHEED